MPQSTYKKRLVFLSALAAILAVIYILALVFDPARHGGRAFAWLEPRLHPLADRIEISGPSGDSVLIRRNDVWFLTAAGIEYPVRQQRVQDLFAVLSRRDVYSLRSASLEAREPLGLSLENASRILVRGGVGLPLLDLLIGISGAVGREVYLARAYEREIYSGEDRFTLFTDSGPEFWLDFRLSGGDPRPAAMIQQAEVTFAPADAPPFSYSLIRSGSGWALQGIEAAEVVSFRVEDWLRAVMEAEGSGFAAHPPAVVHGSITLWFGDGTNRSIQIGTLEASGEESGANSGGEAVIAAAVSDSPLVYVLSAWTVSRLFRESGEFLW